MGQAPTALIIARQPQVLSDGHSRDANRNNGPDLKGEVQGRHCHKSLRSVRATLVWQQGQSAPKTSLPAAEVTITRAQEKMLKSKCREGGLEGGEERWSQEGDSAQSFPASDELEKTGNQEIKKVKTTHAATPTPPSQERRKQVGAVGGTSTRVDWLAGSACGWDTQGQIHVRVCHGRRGMDLLHTGGAQEVPQRPWGLKREAAHHP